MLQVLKQVADHVSEPTGLRDLRTKVDTCMASVEALRAGGMKDVEAGGSGGGELAAKVESLSSTLRTVQVIVFQTCMLCLRALFAAHLYNNKRHPFARAFAQTRACANARTYAHAQEGTSAQPYPHENQFKIKCGEIFRGWRRQQTSCMQKTEIVRNMDTITVSQELTRRMDNTGKI